MTILLDPRAGSGPLYRPLLRLGLPVERQRLRFGDFSFHGSGPSGKVRVGVEYKTLSDLLSCITDKRLVAHQIPGMLSRYDYSYLVIEGVIRPAPDLSLESFHLFSTRKGKEIGAFNRVFAHLTYSQVQRYLFTLENVAGVRVRFTSTKSDTLGYLAALYNWWQKPWDKHHSHLALPAREDSHPRVTSILFRRPSVLRRIASCLPGVGWHKSLAVAKQFGSVSAFVDATQEEWLAIPGIGKTLAGKIHRALREQGRD